MAENKVEKTVTQIALPIAEKLGYELVETEYVKEGPNYYLRIYIDCPEGITIDDCEKMNNAVEPALDAKDPIPQAYFLEISSPGLDRPLKSDRDFEKYTGEQVEVSLYEAIDGSKHYEGELKGKVNKEIIIKTDKDKEIFFPVEKVSTVKRSIKF